MSSKLIAEPRSDKLLEQIKSVMDALNFDTYFSHEEEFDTLCAKIKDIGRISYGVAGSCEQSSNKPEDGK